MNLLKNWLWLGLLVTIPVMAQDFSASTTYVGPNGSTVLRKETRSTDTVTVEVPVVTTRVETTEIPAVQVGVGAAATGSSCYSRPAVTSRVVATTPVLVADEGFSCFDQQYGATPSYGLPAYSVGAEAGGLTLTTARRSFFGFGPIKEVVQEPAAVVVDRRGRLRAVPVRGR